jgi:hypothetical protein
VFKVLGVLAYNGIKIYFLIKKENQQKKKQKKSKNPPKKVNRYKGIVRDIRERIKPIAIAKKQEKR